MRKPIVRLESGIDVLKTTGDTDALAHGGGILYREPRKLNIFWTFWEQRGPGEKNFFLFRAPVPQDVLGYFRPELRELSMVSGIEPGDLSRLSASKDPVERLEVVMAITECFGASRVDPNHSPEEVSPFEMVSRWGEVFGVEKGKVPMASPDDYLVRDGPFGRYECGCFDGLFLGRHEKFKLALCAIAENMNDTGRSDSNVFLEHGYGKLEVVSWDPQSFLGKISDVRGRTAPRAAWRNLMKRYARDSRMSGRQEESLKPGLNVVDHRRRSMRKSSQKDRIDFARSIRRESSSRKA